MFVISWFHPAAACQSHSGREQSRRGVPGREDQHRPGKPTPSPAACEILRHSKISITMEIYTMVPDKATLAALKRLSDALSSPDAALPDDAE